MIHLPATEAEILDMTQLSGKPREEVEQLLRHEEIQYWCEECRKDNDGDFYEEDREFVLIILTCSDILLP